MKGKRKWNFLDVVIVVMAIAVIAVFLNRNQLFNSPQAASSPTGKTMVYFEAEAFKQTDETLGGFVIGDQVVSQNKLQSGTIEKIEIRNTLKTVIKPDGELAAYEDALEKVIVVGIMAEVNKIGPYMELGGQALKVGGNYFIKTDKAEVYGKIKSIEVK